MPPPFEQLVVFLVMTILVGLFAWIYLRDRGKTAGLWMFGWVAILAHFATPIVSGSAAPRPFSTWVRVATLIIAGSCFLFSVSEVLSRRSRRVAFLVLISAASLLYLTGLVVHWRTPWFYAGLLLATNLYGGYQAFHFYKLRSPYFYIFVLLLPCYGGWAIGRAFSGHPASGLEFYLFSFFASTGLIYLRHFKRYSPGIIFTSLSFIAWGSVFPVASFLQLHHIGPVPQSFFWDLPKYFVAFGMLLTLFENKTAAAESAASQYRTLFEGNLAAVYVSTFDGQLLDCNSAFLRMYGFDSKEEALADSHISDCADSSERRVFLDALNRHGQVLNYECRHHRKDGTPFWILERATIVTDSFGRRVIEGTAIDITERKQAEIALKQSEERFATIFRQSPIGCAIISSDGRFLNANDHLLNTLGRTADQVIGKSTVELGFFPSDEEGQKFQERLLGQGSIRNIELSFKDGAGNVHHGLYFASVVWIGDKQCIFGMLLDQTEQRELERKFLQAQKMEALGRLAGGVAHDFNNLLGVVGGYAELLEKKVGFDENSRRYCMKILDTTERAGALTRQLLTFGRKEIVRPVSLRPDEIIRDLNSILPRLIGEDIELVLNLQSTRTLMMDKTHFEQVILNIVMNSRDAMPHGGQLFIETEDISCPAVSDRGTSAVTDYLAVRIRDTGLGMDEETRAHAFEPFYTTKDIGRGTGLGLATVYAIVQQCKGEINIDSSPGRGTRVSILLPAVSEPEPVPAPPVSEELQNGTGTILLVEDEPELRNSNAEFLTSMGYSVKCASSGAEALAIAADAGRIDLVISDVVMPKMNGREFADRLLKLRPDTKLLFVSGYADDVVLRVGISLQGTPFLQKPFSLRQLGSTVNELLAANKLS
jgi:two-component system, cell cycle sensor histidine kinase and response regulator CckA